MRPEYNPSPKEVKIRAAGEFMRRVASGEEQEAVAADVGIGPRAHEVQLAITRAKERARAYMIHDAQERREFVIGSMLEVLSTGEHKDRVAAARMLASDPDLGFQTNPLVELKFSQEVLELPGKPVFAPAAAPAVDVEFEEAKTDETPNSNAS